MSAKPTPLHKLAVTTPTWPVRTFDPQSTEMPICPACGEDRMEKPCEHCGTNRKVWPA